ncbi:cyclase family protein [Acidimangrovimonas sediminis]|uniref:cyclase family protein n=1 Tax=Acidimangrovimonas sediminis TaxID=2056283 RepID=UPI000C80794E|nr:cyclase family protein [Acidimangrovimonas sediminis]
MADTPAPHSSGTRLTPEALIARHRAVDLTHELHPGMPVWPGHPPMCHDLCDSYETGGVSKYHALSLGEHTGTHLDAPVHFVAGGATIAEVPVDQLALRLACLQMPGRAPDHPVTAEEIEAWETRHGRLQERDAVMFHFGWDRFFRDDPERFLASWPGLSGAAAALLVARGVVLAGCDCLSIDPSDSADFAAHRALLGNGVLIGENFNNLGLLPPASTLVGLPLPIRDGTGAPLRAVALIADQTAGAGGA